MFNTFRRATVFNADLTSWDVSKGKILTCITDLNMLTASLVCASSQTLCSTPHIFFLTHTL